MEALSNELKLEFDHARDLYLSNAFPILDSYTSIFHHYI